ncbi:MAG TPA: MFS transporter [Bacteroidales bacterium]|nr:MFS transporter [Bacteroidales bacterium]
MQSQTEKISVREKIGFALGDAAANFIFQTIMLLQLSFYANTFGIGGGTIAILFLVGRLIGAVADPVMGVIADRTETRWGKFRPWILWTAVPFGLFGFLAFFTPDMEPSGKVVWAFITYILLMLVYSANNVPYSALSGVITGDQKQRSSMFSVRFVFVVLAQLAIQGFAAPMVNHFGKGDSEKGYMITMGIFSALAMIFFLITFSTTKERIKPSPAQKPSLKEDISSLLQNKQWVILFLVFIMTFTFLSLRNGMLLFYFQNYLDLPSMTDFMNKLNNGMGGFLEMIGLAGQNADPAVSVFGITNIFGQLASLLGIVISSAMGKKMGKRNILVIGLIPSTLFIALFYVVSPANVMMVLLLQVLFNLSWGITMAIPWAMLADVADYSDWKHNRRATALLFAGGLIGLKVGLAIGGAISGMLLKWYGYVAPAANQALVQQSDTAIQGIRLSSSLYPALSILIIIGILMFYKIDRATEIQMQNELAERRKQY